MAAISMAMTITSAGKNRVQPPTADAFLKTLPLRESRAAAVVNFSGKNNAKLRVEASLKEKTVAAVTSAALTAAMMVPEAASAAESFSPSLKNFLLSIGAGGFVVFAIIGAVIGVSNFDPVKRS